MPISIESRLPKISSNEKKFNESVSIYLKKFNESVSICLKARDKSGYNHKLKFQKTSPNDTQRRQRKRNVIWFNPPFSKSAVTKIR